jgi:hypothetical protein
LIPSRDTALIISLSWGESLFMSMSSLSENGKKDLRLPESWLLENVNVTLVDRHLPPVYLVVHKPRDWTEKAKTFIVRSYKTRFKTAGFQEPVLIDLDTDECVKSNDRVKFVLHEKLPPSLKWIAYEESNVILHCKFRV